jgi:NET1-associated nuclear protein 1 (U3 small nucleolar RNA-associated protein 17)
MPLEVGERHAGGGKIATFPIVFTNDSKYFFCACGNLVKMFSVTTGEQTRVLQGHEAGVVGIAIHPQNPLLLYSFGRDRKIILWEYNDALILHRYKLPFAVEHFAFAPNRSNIVYLAAFGSRVKNGATLPSYDIYEFSLDSNYDSEEGDGAVSTKHGSKNAKSQIRQPKMLLQMKARARSSFLATPDGEYLIVQSKRHWKIFHLATGKTKKFNHRNNISCIAIHPKQHFVATGDDIGEIIFWYVFGNVDSTDDSTAKLSRNGTKRTIHTLKHKDGDEDEAIYQSSKIRDDPVTTTVHWHAHRVGAITFDSSGAHMYSGGQEMVLVIWQLESGKKDWLPRLSAPILGMSHTPDETLLAIRCSDNTIKLINSRSRLLQVSVEGINLATPYLDLSMLSGAPDTVHAVLRQHRRAQRLMTGLVVEPRTNSFVFNATEGQLQFYNPQEDKNILKVQVGPKNPVKTFQDKHVAESTVTHVAFAANGDWMVTVDSRDDQQLGQSSLRFWYWDKPTQQYELNTQYNLSKSEKIRSIAYHPKKDQCVCVSADGKFKIWSVKQNTSEQEDLENSSTTSSTGGKSQNKSSSSSQGKKSSHPAPRVEILEGSAKYRWSVEAAASYRSLEPRASCFSSDGSLLAIAYQHIITLWNPNSNTLLSTLTYPPDHEPITKLSFLAESHYLVSCTKRRLFVWDLLTCQLKWSHVVNVDILTADSKSSKFAIFSPIASVDWGNMIQQAANDQSTQIMFKPNETSGSANGNDQGRSEMEIDDYATDAESVTSTSSRFSSRATVSVTRSSVLGGPAITPSTNKKSSLNGEVKTDGYILLFTPDSPAPLGLWVMPALGVRGVSFLPSRNRASSAAPTNANASSRASSRASYAPSALIYLNGQHEFKFLTSSDETTDLADGDLTSAFALNGAATAMASPSKAKKNQSSLQLQQQFISKINATKLAEGPSVFSLMYGAGTSSTAAPADVPKPAGGISLPKIATASKKAPLPKGASAHASPQARQAAQLTDQLLQNLFQSDVLVIPAPSTIFPQFADALIFKTTSQDPTSTPAAAAASSSSIQAASAATQAPSSSNTTAPSQKTDKNRYVAPKKLMAAKLAHAELSTEAKLLETEVASLSFQGKSDLSFLDEFFATVPVGSYVAPEASMPAQTPKTPRPSKSLSTTSNSTPNKESAMEVSATEKSPGVAPLSSSKKRKRSRSITKDD